MINYDISSPNDVTYVADWVEFHVAYEHESLSKAELSSSIEGAQGDEPSEDFISSVWNELEIRQILYGENSPFRVNGGIIEPILNWKDKPFYMAFLIYSLEGNPNTPETTAVDGGKLFEKICREAIEKYVGGKALIYGFPAEQTVQEIATAQLNEKFVFTPPGYRKDRNLDIFAWKPFGDNRSSQVVILVQCATGFNWKGKLNELNISAWTKYIHFSATPIKGFAAPVTVTNAQRIEEHSTDGGIFFDRLRLFRLLTSLPQELHNECIDWCTIRLKQILNE
mgnify:CR=1 FL=1